MLNVACSARHDGNKTTEEHLTRIRRALYDYGPQTSEELSQDLGLSPTYIRKMMPLLVDAGEVSRMSRPYRRGLNTIQRVYFVLEEYGVQILLQ